MKDFVLFVFFTGILFSCSPSEHTSIQSQNGRADSINTNSGSAGSTNTSPYTKKVNQPDGTTLEILGKGNRNAPYTETLDGYTLLKNNNRIYEYAVMGQDGKLKPGGVKARNIAERTKKENDFLATLNKHLRNQNNNHD